MFLLLMGDVQNDFSCTLDRQHSIQFRRFPTIMQRHGVIMPNKLPETRIASVDKTPAEHRADQLAVWFHYGNRNCVIATANQTNCRAFSRCIENISGIEQHNFFASRTNAAVGRIAKMIVKNETKQALHFFSPVGGWVFYGFSCT
jgi:hypothetical protein